MNGVGVCCVGAGGDEQSTRAAAGAASDAARATAPSSSQAGKEVTIAAKPQLRRGAGGDVTCFVPSALAARRECRDRFGRIVQRPAPSTLPRIEHTPA